MSRARGRTPDADELARRRAREELRVSLALSAGAGSGKTSVLTERVVALLEDGIAPGELAAITFTEKAAGELLSRVRDALEQRLAEARQAGGGARVTRLETVLARFGELTLATIHSFCRDLLRHESLESGFAPATEIGDDHEESARVAATTRAWLAALRVGDPRLYRIVEELVSFRQLTGAVKVLHRYRQHRDLRAEERLDPLAARRELRRLVTAIADAERACACPEEDVLVRNNRPLVALLEVASETADPQDGMLEVLLSDADPKRSGGKAKDWRDGKEGKARYVEELERVLAWRARWRERAHAELLRSLRAELLPRLEQARLDASASGFDDLLVDAARLLRESGGARARLARRYRVVLVDEVQDTDPVQAEVALLLTRAGEASGPWHAHAPEPGRLFAVGDPKQSIYRFRGADVETFGRIEATVGEANRASLKRNFRSVPGLVAWANHVFSGLPGHEAQVAHRGPAPLDPVVLLQASEAVDETEAALRYLGALFEARAEVVDRETGAPRPLRPRDIMLLLPAWSRADGIADRLRAAGLECIVEGGDTFFRRDEVRLGLAALRALVEPADGEAVVLVLRGLFGRSHAELAEHARLGSFRYTIPSQPAGAVADALGVLLRLHRRLGTAGLAVLLDQLLEETRATAVWALLPDRDARLANLDKLRAMVREVEARTTSPLSALDELARRQREVKDKDIDRIDDDGDAIRVTTLFKAKGLEAPVVVLLHAWRRLDPIARVVDEAAGTLALRVGGLAPPGWEAIEAGERQQQLAERRRWTYVAATRARDQLVICRPPGYDEEDADEDGDEARSAGSPAGNDLLAFELEPRGLPGRSGLVDGALVELAARVAVRVRLGDALPAVLRPDETYPGHDGEVDGLLAEPPACGDPGGEARAAEVHERVRAATRGCLRWRAASTPERPVRWTVGSPLEEGAAALGVGTRGGQVVHAVMERLDLSLGRAELEPRADELAALLGERAGLPEEKREACRNVVRRILANPLLAEARRAPERWHEVPFTYSPRRGSVVSGAIDLCFPLDAERRRWVVFDWKSHVPPREHPLHEKYREQLARYARALLAALGEVEVRTEIVGPHPELGDVASADERFADVSPALQARLGELLDRGAPFPAVGLDVGEPAVSVELAWEERRLAVDPALGAPERAALEAQGWTVRAALDAEVEALLALEPAAPEDE
jgi:exodeoxyribonuclease-5/CRISPR-associated exonuclease Cas4